MKYKVLMNRILVEPHKAEVKTASGIIIPDSAQEKPQKGTVVDVGDIQGIKLGDKVVYKQFTGTEVIIDNVLYYIFREDDILLIEK